MLLVGGGRVAVAGRDHHSLDIQVHHGVEELAYSQGRSAIEQGGIGGDPEPASHRFLYGFHRDVVDPVSAHRLVVFLAEAVHVDAEAKVLGGLEQALFQFLLQVLHLFL